LRYTQGPRAGSNPVLTTNLKTKVMSETYIITFEDGSQYVASQITTTDENAVSDGIMTVIRCSDAKTLLPSGEWVELLPWE
jgi:hypothetical protein